MIPGASLHAVGIFVVLAAVFLYLSRQQPTAPLTYWGLAWVVLGLRQLLASVVGTPLLPWVWVDVALVAAAAGLVFIGALAVAARSGLDWIRASLVGIGLGLLSVVAVTALIEIYPARRLIWARALGVVGAAWIGAGWLVDRYGRDEAPIGARTAGLALVAWGGLLPLAWAVAAAEATPASWVLLETGLEVVLGVGMLVYAIDAARTVGFGMDPRRLLDEDPDMVLVAAGGRPLYLNRALRERTGWKVDDEASIEALGPLVAAAAEDEELEWELTVGDERIPVIARSHEIAWEGTRAHKIELDDITALRESEAAVRAVNEELQRINLELERTNVLKTEFLSNTSHELKTPLTSIIANTEILEYEMLGPVNEDQRRVLSSINRNSQHLLEMISQLLDFARHEEGYGVLRYQPTDIVDIVVSVAETTRPLLEEGERRLVVEVESGLAPVWIDYEKIYRVYLNLVENAIKFSGEGEITVAAQRVDGELEGSVSDRGIGIPEAKLEEIFEAFQQVDASPTRAYEGVGLGLAICRQLVELHGGRIWAESKAGEGSVFRFRIPYRTDPPPAAVRATTDTATDGG